VERAAALGPYSGVLKKLVAAYKFRGYDILAAPAGARLADLAKAAGIGHPDVVVPVPSTARRNRERGYDPARLLAEETARHLGRPVRTLLERRRDTEPQSGLPASAREANVAGVFRARPCSGARVLLVDDVLTTGATAFSAACTLRDAGAAGVDVVVVARTPAFESDSIAEIA